MNRLINIRRVLTLLMVAGAVGMLSACQSMLAARSERLAAAVTASAMAWTATPQETLANPVKPTGTLAPPTDQPSLARLEDTQQPALANRISPDNITQIKKWVALGRGRLGTVELTRNGNYAAVLSTRGISLYALDRMDELFWLQAENLVSLALAPNLGYVAGISQDGQLKLWDLQPLELLRTGSARCAAFDPAGEILASGTDNGTVRIESVLDENKVWLLEGHTRAVNDISFSPDGTVLATSGEDGRIRLWDPQTGKILFEIRAVADAVDDLVFSPDGQYLASASIGQKVILVWQIGKTAPLIRLDNQSIERQSMAFSPDSTQLISIDEDRQRIIVRSLVDGQITQEITRSGAKFIGLAVAENGRLALADANGQIELWNLVTRSPESVLRGFSLLGEKLIFSSDSQLLSYGALVWRVADQQVVALQKDYPGTTWDAAINPSNQILTTLTSYAENTGSSWLYMLRLENWAIEDGSLLDRIDLPGYWGSVNALSPDYRRAVAGSTNLTAWFLEGQPEKRVIAIHENTVNDLRFSADGKSLATASDDRTVKIWDAGSFTLKRVLRGYSAGVSAVAFSGDNSLLASGVKDGTVNIWALPSGTLSLEINAHTNPVIDLAFSPEALMLATLDAKGAVRIWRVADGSLLYEILDGVGISQNIAFSPDGKILAIGLYDGAVYLLGIYP